MANEEKKIYEWSKDKNNWLLKNRGISFEEMSVLIEGESLISVTNHPNQKKYSGQKIYIVLYNDYVYKIPFVRDGEKCFLKTIVPSRKLTAKYLKGEK